MDKALLFYNGEPVLVSAEEIRDGKYPKDSEFVDAEYPDYKVRYVSAGRPAKDEEVGIPYFRLYYSYEEYKNLYPDRADKYKIVADMRRFQESQWHREWKEKLSPFCETEKYFEHDKRWKYADAFYAEADACIELQHSYAGLEFEDRNEFYMALKKKMIWLFNLPKAQVREAEDGTLEILEDNARGFFRAAYETQDKFGEVSVFIQTKSRKIYRVIELYRKNGDYKGHIATLRFFKPNGIWTEEEWIEDLRAKKLWDSNIEMNNHEEYHDIVKDAEQVLSTSNFVIQTEVEKQEEECEIQSDIECLYEFDSIEQERLDTQKKVEEEILKVAEEKRQAKLKKDTEAQCVELGVLDINLLSKEEAWYLPKSLIKKTEPWWLSTKADTSFQVLVEYKSGYQIPENVNYSKGIRPVLRLREDKEDPYCEGLKIELAGHIFTVINGHSALCDDLIGSSAFRKNITASDANDYSASDIKNYIEEWCKKNYIKFVD